MLAPQNSPNIRALSVMLAVTDAPAAVEWYRRGLGATLLWDLGSVAGLEIDGSPFFVGEPGHNGWTSPTEIGTVTVRVELFCEDPDAVIRRALDAGADGKMEDILDHQMPWGIHRQGRFTDPFGHLWLVGNTSPLSRFPRTPDQAREGRRP